ncbi:uncharacterized protein [Palaemon carinicauda]|uniref:uncharacterized protein n=1 Tax=Palaemon carinicauda TaxID=392227 RepID=UPI0035B66BF1
MRFNRRFNTKTYILILLGIFFSSGVLSKWKRGADVAGPEASWDLPNHLIEDDNNLKSLDEIMSMAKGPVSADDPELIKQLRRAYLYPPSSQPYNLKEGEPEDIIYTDYKKVFPSWAFINSVLEDLFYDGPPGFFVEAGALDGEYLSNTLQLEVRKSWSGLLVEADRKSFDILRKKNRKAWSSPACISTEVYPKEVVLSSFVRQGKTSVWRDRGAARIEKDPVFQESGPGYKTFQKVQCFPTLTFLMALNISKVDFFSLDVEGVEMDILKAFPFDRVAVDVWAIEHIGKPKNDSLFHRADSANGKPWEFEDPEFVAFMESRGYYLFDMFCNPIPDYIFVRRDSRVFRRLNVPENLWVRRGLCFQKPKYDANGYHFLKAIHRDRRHWPTLRYSSG